MLTPERRPSARLDYGLGNLRHGVSRNDFSNAPWTHFWLFDIKAADPEKHLRFTGRTNDRILSNLRLLDESGASVELRCPLVPGWNDSDSDLFAIRDLARSLKSRPNIRIEPFHPFGRGKLASLGLPERENARIPEKEDIARWQRLLDCPLSPVDPPRDRIDGCRREE